MVKRGQPKRVAPMEAKDENKRLSLEADNPEHTKNKTSSRYMYSIVDSILFFCLRITSSQAPGPLCSFQL